MIYQRSQKKAVNLTNTHTYGERQKKYNQSQDTQQYTTSTTTKTKVKQTKNPKPMEEREKIFKAKQTNTRVFPFHHWHSCVGLLCECFLDRISSSSRRLRSFPIFVWFVFVLHFVHLTRFFCHLHKTVTVSY